MTFPAQNKVSAVGRLIKLPTFGVSLGFVLLAIALFWLRGPSLSVPVWNVDETIHSTIAEVLLDGGTLYTDAIDQRSPLTYYATALVFGLTDGGLPALRGFVTLMLIGAAFALARLVGSQSGGWAGVATAFVFISLSQALLHPFDAFAANTEWFVLLFTTMAAVLFLRTGDEPPTIRTCLGTGALLGAAVMSKQSALLELLPPFAAIAALCIDRRGVLAGLRCSGALLTGALAVSVAVCLPSILSGAARDLWFYAWTYNLQFYGAEFSFGEKLQSGFRLCGLLTDFSLILTLFAGLGLLSIAVRSVQRPSQETTADRRYRDVYLFTWVIVAWGSAAAGGRGFDHYFIPLIAPLTLVIMEVSVRLPKLRISAGSAVGPTISVVICLLAALPAWRSRRSELPPPDPALRVAEWMQAQSVSSDRIFVWGFNPDIYHYTDRLPASRFLYCTFQTGLIPWTNTDPTIDTAYAVVPGSLETLLQDLETHQPRFIIDSSAGPHRFFSKYPLRNFPPLNEWIRQNYVEVESARFGAQGFRLFGRAETQEFDPQLVPQIPPEQLSVWMQAAGTKHGHMMVRVGAHSHDQPLTALGFRREGDSLIHHTEFVGVDRSNVLIRLPASAADTEIVIEPIARYGTDDWIVGEPQTMVVNNTITNLTQAQEYALPLVSRRVPATQLSAMFGARVEASMGVRQFAMHAPSLLAFDLPADANVISGRFGLPPEAYAEENPSPSDGASFRITVQIEGQQSRELLNRTLRPHIEDIDRVEQSFRIELPSSDSTRQLTLEIDPGPSGDASSDWTYWTDVRLETSP